MSGEIHEPEKWKPQTKRGTLDKKCRHEMFEAVKEIDKKNERRPSLILKK